MNERIQQTRAALEDANKEGSNTGDADAARAELKQLLDDLKQHQGETPMVPVQVDGHVIAEIVAGWTGIPLGKMVKD
ncbi:hypothetical protein ACPXAZ_25515, partial [Escherichia coli]|uniref:hypothetical protein n=1 Tax=Escherichia coli TaxID=562 RepID=UPI003CE4FF4A